MSNPLLELGKEYPGEDEAALIKEIADITLRAAQFIKVSTTSTSIESPAPASKPSPNRRLPHHKSHGCVNAEFKVRDDLPRDLTGGIFQPGAKYRAKLRFSNGDVRPGVPDDVRDIRGMAVKVYVPDMQQLALDTEREQDFLLASHKAFFSRGLPDFLEFTVSMTRFKALERHFEKYPELSKIYNDSQVQIESVLGLQYYSQVPYRLGQDGPAVKFSARPSTTRLAGAASRNDPNFLETNLKQHLAENEASFDFLVQRQVNADLMPVEDPSVVWPEEESLGGTPFVKVATLTIPVQSDFDKGEILSFNPWNGLDPSITDPEEAARRHPHRPLGAINRARRAIYGNAFKLRMKLPTQDTFTGIMTLKDPVKGLGQLKAILMENGLVNAFALQRLGFVHFARFIILADAPPPDTKVANFLVITTFDFDFRDYVQAFIDEIGDVFDQLLPLMQGAPPTPVREHRAEFMEYVKDIGKIGTRALFYSAYPNLSVQNILTLENS